MSEYSLFLISSYFAAVAATIAGFGSSTLLIPVALFFMASKPAIVIVACFHLFNNLFKVRLFKGHIDYQTFWRFGIPSIIFAFIGAYLISYLPEQTIQRGIAFFLVAFSLFSLIKADFKLENTKAISLLGGSLSGLLAGLIGLGGAVRSMFLITFNLKKEVYIATAALIALVVDFTRIPTYIFTNTVEDSTYYKLLPFLIVTAYAGVKTGKSLLHKINQDAFRRIVYFLVLAVGCKLLF